MTEEAEEMCEVSRYISQSVGQVHVTGSMWLLSSVPSRVVCPLAGTPCLLLRPLGSSRHI